MGVVVILFAGCFAYLEIFFPIKDGWDKWADDHCETEVISREEFIKIKSSFFGGNENASDAEFYTKYTCDDGEEYVRAGS